MPSATATPEGMDDGDEDGDEVAADAPEEQSSAYLRRGTSGAPPQCRRFYSPRAFRRPQLQLPWTRRDFAAAAAKQARQR